MKKKIRIATLIFGVFVFSLTVAEFAVRVWAPQELISDILALDETLCHRLKRNIEGVQNSREFNDIQIRTNSFGVRDRQYSIQKGENTFRFLILGDSHTLGWGVNVQDSFTKLIEQRLNENSDGFTYEVINCGMYGYGTLHQYQFLQKTGYNLQPDMVVVAMDFLHDIRVNNEGYFYFQGSEVVRSAKECFAQKSRSVTRYIPFSSYLRGHSHFFRFAGVTFQSLWSRFSKRPGTEANAKRIKEIYALDDTKRIFRKVKLELQQRGIEFGVVILPEFNSEHQNSRSSPLFLTLLNSFHKFLEEENIDYTSLQEKFEQHQSFSELTFKYSHHFTPEGHEFIATQVKRFLQENSSGAITNGT